MKSCVRQGLWSLGALGLIVLLPGGGWAQSGPNALPDPATLRRVRLDLPTANNQAWLEAPQVKRSFPGLSSGQIVLVAAKSGRYNAIGYTLGAYSEWVW